MTEKRYTIASYDTGMPGIHLCPPYSTRKAAVDQLRIVMKNTLVRVCNMQVKVAESTIQHALNHPYERGVCEFDMERGIAKVHYSTSGKPEIIWFQVVEI